MDASLVLAIDSLRNVAATASEVIVANFTTDDGDRCAVATCNDIESACRRVFAVNAPPSLLPLEATVQQSAAPKMSLLSLPLLSSLMMGGSSSDADAEAAAAHVAAVSSAQLEPITDIICTYGTEPIPEGYKRLVSSVTGHYSADLNASSGPRQTWLAVARAPNAPPITSLTIVLLELGEFIPPGFQPVRHAATYRPGNLRGNPVASASSEALLCFSRAAGAPIIDIGIAFPYGAAGKTLLRTIMSSPISEDGRDGMLWLFDHSSLSLSLSLSLSFSLARS
jgi:hypothetical protein